MQITDADQSAELMMIIYTALDSFESLHRIVR